MKWLFAIGVTSLFLPADAHAYLDPGSGSAILQGILGALAALAITLKLYWHRLLRFLRLRKPVGYSDSDESEDTERSRQDDS